MKRSTASVTLGFSLLTITAACVGTASDVDVELTMSRGEPVLVQLVDASTGKGVEGYVAVFDASGQVISGDSRPTNIDSGGGFRYWLKPGSYTLRVMARDHEPKTTPLVVPGTPTVRIELKPLKRD